ncbi:MAG: hypothetical protein KDD10_27705 [Phaeodactylibacter sp.]|nr:hypothetical protein [Phaeodactylibacter sp.]MCB9298429.1 fatty-acid oxidation protein subunit alpha [Lewinellaceae bacterium]
MAKDVFHIHVKEALEKDGWAITDDPYVLRAEEIEYEVDLGAEKLIAATKANEKIAVEVKSFLRQSKVYEMHNALGQFNTYAFALKSQEPSRTLYLAVPENIYLEFFQRAQLRFVPLC